MNRRIRFWGGISFKTKLFVTYLTLIFLPLALLTFILYTSVFNVFETQMKYSAEQSFQQAHSYLSYKLSAMITISDTIYFNTDVQEILVKSKVDYADDVFQQTIDMQKLDAFLNNFRSDDLYRVRLYVPGWFMYADQGMYIGNYDAFALAETYQKLIQAKDKVLWVPNDELAYENALSAPIDVVSLFRRVRNRSQINDVIGVIQLGIRQNSIDSIIVNADISKHGVVFLRNQDGVVVSRSDTENLDRFLSEEAKPEPTDDPNWHTVMVGFDRYLVMESGVSGTDWTMTAAIPYSELLSQSNSIQQLMVVLVAVIGAASYILSYLMSRSSLRRITYLTGQMRNVHSNDKYEPGGVEAEVPRLRRDEFDQMIDTFHFMVKRIDLLAQEQYQNGKEIKSAELRALQAQINPHFLYNTLDLISWKAIEHGADEIVLIVRALAQFYKLSLSHGRDIVPLRYELEHIRVYVQIQNQRFEQGIELVIDVDERFHNHQVPKITLQPLVENSILHGIMNKDDAPRGKIEVKARLEDGELIVSVTDDGVGMEEKKVEQLLKSSLGGTSSGYGVHNIDHRLKLCYGQEYGLKYLFPKGGGVTVEIHIPVIQDVPPTGRD